MKQITLQEKLNKAKQRTSWFSQGINISWPEEEQWKAHQERVDHGNWAEKKETGQKQATQNAIREAIGSQEG